MKEIRIRLPEFKPPHKTAWREEIHNEISKYKVKCLKTHKVELLVRFYLDKEMIKKTDIDNMLKDVMDALQGYVCGHKKKYHSRKRIICNDNQIYKVTVEKKLPPKQSHNKGHLIVKFI